MVYNALKGSVMIDEIQPVTAVEPTEDTEGTQEVAPQTGLSAYMRQQQWTSWQAGAEARRRFGVRL